MDGVAVSLNFLLPQLFPTLAFQALIVSVSWPIFNFIPRSRKHNDMSWTASCRRAPSCWRWPHLARLAHSAYGSSNGMCWAIKYRRAAEHTLVPGSLYAARFPVVLLLSGHRVPNLRLRQPSRRRPNGESGEHDRGADSMTGGSGASGADGGGSGGGGGACGGGSSETRLAGNGPVGAGGDDGAGSGDGGGGNDKGVESGGGEENHHGDRTSGGRHKVKNGGCVGSKRGVGTSFDAANDRALPLTKARHA
ncbi:unnamed protein product [Phaeothamnion confervicola]